MSLTDKLAQERRGRLAAERMLELKSRELMAANRKLSDHALKLSDTIVHQREVVELTRAEAAALKREAETMKGVAQETRADLERAEKAVTIAERRLWDSVETITDGFAVFDSQDRLVAANSAWLGFFDGLEAVRPGITYIDMLRLMIEEGLVDPGEAAPEEWLAAMLDRWDAETIPDATIRTWNGRHLRLHDRRARDGDMVCLALDITSTIRREGELKKARDAAEAATRAKSAFLARMSHELRTPMNGVVGMAELLLETEIDEEQALFIQTIRNSGEALLEIINDVLDFSRAEAERLVLYPEPFDLEAMLVEVVMLSMPAAREKGLELLLDYAPGVPARFVADPKRLRQVVVNLLGNALKFTEAGHVKIAVSAAPPAGGGPWAVEIAVEDTGIGIAAHMREHIFGQFNQVEDAQNRKYEGTGLGLAITRQLVELMGGEIALRSAEGAGTTFTLRLALEAVEPPAPLPRWPADAPPLILLGIASPGARALARERFAARGAEVEPLRGAAAVAARAEAGPVPDMAMLAADLGEAELARLVPLLRAAWPRTRLVLLALHGPAGGAAGAATGGKGFDAVLRYPFRRAEAAPVCEGLPSPPLRLEAGAAGTGAGEMARPETGGETPTEPGPMTRPMRVLAAEDNRTNRLVFAKMLKGLDLDLAFAGDGREAVALYRSLRPDLVFMDISMPGMDGKEATRAIRALEAANRWPRVPVVAMTAHAMAGDAADILAAGLDHYLTKPLKKAAIREQIALHAPEGVAICGTDGVARAAG